MSRQRFIYPEFFDSSDLGGLPIQARLLFAGLFTLADDLGRGRAGVSLLRGRVFAYDSDVTDKMVEHWLDLIRLQNPGDPMVMTYTVRGQRFYWLPKWDKYQTPKHVKPSRIPEYESKWEDPRPGSGLVPPLSMDPVPAPETGNGPEPGPGRGPDSIVLNGIGEGGEGSDRAPSPARTRTKSVTKAARTLVEFYVDTCRTHGPSDVTPRSAQRVLDAGDGEACQAAVLVYAAELQRNDPPQDRRIKPHNWFGRKGRWKEYTNTNTGSSRRRPADAGEIPASMPGDDPPANTGEPSQARNEWRWQRQGRLAGLISRACSESHVALERHAAVNLAYQALQTVLGATDTLPEDDPNITAAEDWKPAPTLQEAMDQVVEEETKTEEGTTS